MSLHNEWLGALDLEYEPSIPIPIPYGYNIKSNNNNNNNNVIMDEWVKDKTNPMMVDIDQ